MNRRSTERAFLRTREQHDSKGITGENREKRGGRTVKKRSSWG